MEFKGYLIEIIPSVMDDWRDYEMLLRQKYSKVQQENICVLQKNKRLNLACIFSRRHRDSYSIKIKFKYLKSAVQQTLIYVFCLQKLSSRLQCIPLKKICRTVTLSLKGDQRVSADKKSIEIIELFQFWNVFNHFAEKLGFHVCKV